MVSTAFKRPYYQENSEFMRFKKYQKMNCGYNSQISDVSATKLQPPAFNQYREKWKLWKKFGAEKRAVPSPRSWEGSWMLLLQYFRHIKNQQNKRKNFAQDFPGDGAGFNLKQKMLNANGIICHLQYEEPSEFEPPAKNTLSFRTPQPSCQVDQNLLKSSHNNDTPFNSDKTSNDKNQEEDEDENYLDALLIQASLLKPNTTSKASLEKPAAPKFDSETKSCRSY